MKDNICIVNDFDQSFMLIISNHLWGCFNCLSWLWQADKVWNGLRMKTLQETVLEQIKHTPDALAVIFDDGSKRCYVSLTYKEMWERGHIVCINF